MIRRLLALFRSPPAVANSHGPGSVGVLLTHRGIAVTIWANDGTVAQFPLTVYQARCVAADLVEFADKAERLVMSN
jgi:hypothetical protein